ncbi:Phosphatidylcholine-sterol acyltransferase precursor [Roseovarius litorisediminis]|uniref:Phosphatidylcholine-sterol acyltransferase n=1 Tax=Roseovarius litorisediminis TaxID=1312363 RepID=A0A1Y5T7N2_9RHOB|nr:SGNH/GDSL hydrolase family protein [Roseovarius litorisediminis]SLN57279.1 Phosphatidylcholine-sterol acyltransferase precursor [Roseovarius litorisediminis]
MKNIVIAAVLFLGAAGAAPAATIADAYSSFYAFGDSLSDDGKFGTLDPPSLDGRFSNGPVWVEHIAQLFKSAGRDTGNLALGGATAGNVNLNPAGPLSTFGGQIATFAGSLAAGVGLPTKILPTVEFSLNPPSPGANPLVSILFGPNDIFQGFNPVAAANSVANGIRAIASIGANFDDFLVMSLPDIGATPAFAGAGSAGATAASNAFNAQLALNVAGLRSEGLNIIEFDTESVFQEILADINSGTFKFGIFDARTPCTASIGAPLDPTFSNPGSCLDLGINPNTLLFVDGVHPNGVVHGLVADRAIAAVENHLAAVPLPATLPMLILAVGGIGFIARRRQTA